MLNVLVYGSGGREHALVKALKKSDFVKALFAYPGSSGIFEDASPIDLKNDDINDNANDKANVNTGDNNTTGHTKNLNGQDNEHFERLLQKIKSLNINLVVIGPEKPLVEGLSDYLRSHNISVFGPSKNGAMLEGDKIFSKEFMKEHNIPTASYKKVSDLNSLKKAMEDETLKTPYVFKYIGLAGGKGVLVSEDEEEVLNFAKSFGVTESQKENVAILEQPLEGWELSCICLVNEKGFEICPLLQDHKRLKDNDEGPNTGGMGVAGPLEIDQDLFTQIKEEIVKPTVEGLKRKEFFYRGVIYIGIMVTKEGPKVLEYNVRFGDPEAQLIFPLIKSDWGKILHQVSEGKSFKLDDKNQYGCCVVLASEDYPEAPKKGDKILGLEKLNEGSFCHAGTLKKDDGHFYTSGGRVLNVLGFGNTLKDAKNKAYKNLKNIEFRGMQFRTDIGSKLLD